MKSGNATMDTKEGLLQLLTKYDRELEQTTKAIEAAQKKR